jgi:unspecific monooxygenase
MELNESLGALFATYPWLELAGEPESRGTFVLRGYRSVPVTTHPDVEPVETEEP